MHLWIQYMMTEVCSAGFPHSEIAGSQDICSSPTLIAAYHVFHRLSVPRHPPCALCSMTTSMYSVTSTGRSFLCLKKCVQKNLYSLRFDVNHFQYVVFKVHLIFNRSKSRSESHNEDRTHALHPQRIMLFYKAASTCSPVPSPVKYHRPPVS